MYLPPIETVVNLPSTTEGLIQFELEPSSVCRHIVSLYKIDHLISVYTCKCPANLGKTGIDIYIT